MKGILGLELQVIYKDVDLLEVRVSAWNGVFRGVTDVYVGVDDLGEIASILKRFPTHVSDTREVTLGAMDESHGGGGVGLRFYCIDGSGHARVECKMFSDQLRGAAQSVSLVLPIEAAAVDSFVDELQALNDTGAGIARLCGAV